MSDYQSYSGYGKWYDTPIKNRPTCPICFRHRHGNQRRVYKTDLGYICYKCNKRLGQGDNIDLGWYLDKIVRNNPDYEMTPEQINAPDGCVYLILTSTRFPYVVGQHIYLDEYFQKQGFLDQYQH